LFIAREILASPPFHAKDPSDPIFCLSHADIHFDPEAVIRLIKSGHDVAVAAYPKKWITLADQG
jgi:hypothetical protein